MTSPSTVLFGEIEGASGAATEQAATQIGAAVTDEGAHEYIDHDPPAVRQLAQQDGVRERQADPPDPEQGCSDPPLAARWRDDAEQEGQRQRRDGDEQHLVARAELRCREQAEQRQEARELGRVGRREQPVELVQAQCAQHRQADREHDAALGHQEDRQHQRRHPGDDACSELRTPAPARRRPGLFALARRWATAQHGHHQRPP